MPVGAIATKCGTQKATGSFATGCKGFLKEAFLIGFDFDVFFVIRTNEMVAGASLPTSLCAGLVLCLVTCAVGREHPDEKVSLQCGSSVS